MAWREAAAVVNEVTALLNRLGYTVAWDGSASALEAAAALIGSLDITPHEPAGRGGSDGRA
jgi:hypothetical protein